MVDIPLLYGAMTNTTFIDFGKDSTHRVIVSDSNLVSYDQDYDDFILVSYYV